MLETICPNCRQRYQLGTDHVCKRPAKKSTAPKVVQPNPVAHDSERPAKVNEEAKRLAGHVQPKGAAKNVTSMSERTTVQVLAGSQPHKLGRPRIHPDRKAYKAEHERKRRAKLKNG